MEVFGPSLQLVICGAGHVGGTLLRLAKLLSFETILIDDRPTDQIKDKIDLADRFVQCSSFEEGICSAGIPVFHNGGNAENFRYGCDG